LLLLACRFAEDEHWQAAAAAGGGGVLVRGERADGAAV
jgi:hypothetical protein